MYRRLFAEEPSSFQLKNPHLMLHDVFALPNDKWEFQQESSEEVCDPLYLKWAQKTKLEDRGRFKSPSFLHNAESRRSKAGLSLSRCSNSRAIGINLLEVFLQKFCSCTD